MRRMSIRAWAALAVLACAAPAAAQNTDPNAEPMARISRQLERQAEILALQVERLVDTQIRSFELRNRQVFAQRGQTTGEARRAAQAAREAERRRRNEARRGPEYTEQLTRTVRINRAGTFDLQNFSGNIQVTGSTGNDVRIDATKRVRHPRESEAKTLLQAIDVQIGERNGNVEVRTYPGRNWTGGVDYVVSLPRDANVILRSVSGDIRVTTLNGELRAETMSGNVVASSVRRIRQAKTMSGDLEIVDSEGDEVTGGTVSGTVLARGLKSRSVDLRSVSGDVRVTDIESERAFVQSMTGNVEFGGRVSKTGRYELQSHAGNIRVTPLTSQGFSLEASTFNGNLRSDYPLTLQGRSNNLTGPGGRRIRGSFGDGGALLTLQTFSGNIVITK